MQNFDEYSDNWKLGLILGWFLIPFLIAACFEFTSWMGWPALFIFGLFWIGITAKISEEKEKQEKASSEESAK